MKSRRGGLDNSRQRGRSIVTIPFHRAANVTLTAGQAQIPVAPTALTVFDWLANIAENFELYRFIELEYRLRYATAITGTQELAFYPDAVGTTVTAGPNSENLDCVFLGQFETGQVQPFHKVPRSRLKGQIDWYKTIPDAASSEFESQGRLNFNGTSSETVVLEVRGVVQFKNNIDPTAAAAEMKLRQEKRDAHIISVVKDMIGGRTPGA